MAEQNTLSVVVPALNEEAYLADTVRHIGRAAAACFDDYEIVVVDDGSTDRTGAIADALQAGDAHVRVIHNRTPCGLGGAHRTGLAAATGYYVTRVNGKGGTSPEELRRVWQLKGEADMIVPYTVDATYRPLVRRLISRAFTTLVNLLFGLRLKYYNHFVLHRRELVSSLTLRSDSHALEAEILVKLLKRGHSYVEVGHRDTPDTEHETRAFGIPNVMGVAKFFFWTLYDVYLHPGKPPHPNPLPPGEGNSSFKDIDDTLP